MGEKSRIRNGDEGFALLGKRPHIEMEGNRAFSLDGSFSIIEYSDEQIKLKTAGLLIEIIGRDLLITFVTDNHLFVLGNIISVEFN